MKSTQARWSALLNFFRKAKEFYPNSQTYIVGGAVRDSHPYSFISLPEQEDLDIATSLLPQEIEEVAKATGFDYDTQGAAFLVSVIRKDDYSFEVATFRKERGYEDHRHPSEVVAAQTVEEDAARRDFTINAIYFDPLTDQIVDPVGGERDITLRILRAVGDPFERFSEDYIRILRLYRFQATYDLQISPWTSHAARFLSGHPIEGEPSRIWKELSRIVTAEYADKVIFYEELFTKHLFPFLGRMKNLAGRNDYHPEDNVLEHVHYVFKNAQLLDGDSLPLLLAALYHDAAKPETQTKKPDGGFSFHDHESKSATLAYSSLLSLGASIELAENVQWLVENHMNIKRLPEMRRSKIKRLYEHPMFRNLIFLGASDSYGGSKGVDWEFIKATEDFIASIPQEALKSRGRPKLISGNDLIALGYVPSPIFRKMLEAAEEFELYNPDATKEDVLNVAIWAKENS